MAEMNNTITQEAVVKLTELEEALECLSALLDDKQIGLATILKKLAGIIGEEIAPHILPIKEESREGGTMKAMRILAGWLIAWANALARQACEARFLCGYEGHGLAG